MKRSLTDEQVKQARRQVRKGTAIGDVAQGLRKPYQTIWNAVHGISYYHVKEPAPIRGKTKPYRRRSQTSPRVAAAAAEGRRPCVECELLTEDDSGYCRFCRAEGRA